MQIIATGRTDEFKLNFQLSVIMRIVECKFSIAHRRHYFTWQYLVNMYNYSIKCYDLCYSMM